MRQAAGRQFADVVIGVAVRRRGRPGPRRGRRGRARGGVGAAGGRRRRPRRAERGRGADVRERAHAAALGVPRVREVHNVERARGRRRHRALAAPEASRRPLARGGARDRRAGRARDLRGRCPRSSAVQTHLEPLARRPPGTERARGDAERERWRGSCARRPARAARELRFFDTDDGPRRVSDAAARRRDSARRRARARRARSRSGSGASGPRSPT